MSTQNIFYLFFKYFCILYSVASTHLDYFLFCNNGIEQHRIICRPIFAHHIISDRNRAFDSFVGFGQWVSGSGRETPPASNFASMYNKTLFYLLVIESLYLKPLTFFPSSHDVTLDCPVVGYFWSLVGFIVSALDRSSCNIHSAY